MATDILTTRALATKVLAAGVLAGGTFVGATTMNTASAQGNPPGQGQGQQQWLYQIRFDVTPELAAAYKEQRDDAALQRIRAVLQARGATLTSQYDAFVGYVKEAEREGTADYPLYEWTRGVVADPAKQAKYERVFTVYVNGQGVYAAEAADAVRHDLDSLVAEYGQASGILRVTRLDTNPANSPQPPRRS
jgi:hypothetical protein